MVQKSCLPLVESGRCRRRSPIAPEHLTVQHMFIGSEPTTKPHWSQAAEPQTFLYPVNVGIGRNTR